MGFWNETKLRTKSKNAEFQGHETALYAQVMDELEQGQRDKGLWGKALADCEGDETKANAKYIEFRVQDLAARSAGDELKEKVLKEGRARQRAADYGIPAHQIKGGAGGKDARRWWKAGTWIVVLYIVFALAKILSK